MRFSCVGVLVFGLMVTVNSAPNKGCSIQYQAALQQVLDLKETYSERSSSRTAVRCASYTTTSVNYARIAKLSCLGQAMLSYLV